MADSTSTSTHEVDLAPLDNITVAYEKNKKFITTAITVVVVAVVGYFGYTKWYKGPNEDKASAAMAMPELYLQVDSVDLALNGDGKNLGFTKIASKYDGTSGGNRALYFEGMANMRKGEFDKAISALKKFDGKGTILGYQAWGAIGVCYLEKNDAKNAIEYLKKATGNKEDQLITPMYLYHLGMAYEMTNQTNEAKETFKTIRDEYPRSIAARNMDKELAKLGMLD